MWKGNAVVYKTFIAAAAAYSWEFCGLCEAAHVLPVQVGSVGYLLCAGGLVACLLGLGVADFICCLLWAGRRVGGRAADAKDGPSAVLGVILRKQLCTTTTAHIIIIK